VDPLQFCRGFSFLCFRFFALVYEL